MPNSRKREIWLLSNLVPEWKHKPFWLVSLWNKNERRGTGDMYIAWSGAQGEGRYSLLKYSSGNKSERGNPDAPALTLFPEGLRKLPRPGTSSLEGVEEEGEELSRPRGAPSLPGSFFLPLSLCSIKLWPILYLLCKNSVLKFIQRIKVPDCF